MTGTVFQGFASYFVSRALIPLQRLYGQVHCCKHSSLSSIMVSQSELGIPETSYSTIHWSHTYYRPQGCTVVSDDYLYNLTYIMEDLNPFPLHSLPDENSSLHSILTI